MAFLYADPEKIKAWAAEFGGLGASALTIGDLISAGVLPANYFAGDEYDKPWGQVLEGIPDILSVFPNFDEAMGNLFGSGVTTGQGYHASDLQSSEIAGSLVRPGPEVTG